MTNPVHELAEKLVSEPIQDGSPAEALAHALLHERRDRQLLEERYSELYKRFNDLVHRHAECTNVHQTRANQRTEPAMSVYCDELDCAAVLSIAVAPPEDAVTRWVNGMGWRAEGTGAYLCPVHK